MATSTLQEWQQTWFNETEERRLVRECWREPDLRMVSKGISPSESRDTHLEQQGVDTVLLHVLCQR